MKMEHRALWLTGLAWVLLDHNKTDFSGGWYATIYVPIICAGLFQSEVGVFHPIFYVDVCFKMGEKEARKRKQ